MAHALRKLEREITREQWCYLVDCLKSHFFDSGFNNPALLLSHEVADANSLEGLGEKWSVDAEKLAAHLQELNHTEAWAVISTVQFFWDNSERINLTEDP